MISNEIRSQAVAGLTTPQFSEARLRLVYPTVAANFAFAALGKTLIKTIILAPIAAMLLQLGVSRQREYLADATGAQLLGRAAPLANALETLERSSQVLPMNVNPATASLYAVNPLPRRSVSSLFMTHPPLAERVRRLRALDGLT